MQHLPESILEETAVYHALREMRVSMRIRLDPRLQKVERRSTVL